MRGTRHRVRRLFGAPQRRRFCLPASRGGRRRCHGRHRGRARMRPAGLHAAPDLPAASAGTAHTALRTYSAAHVTGRPPPFQAQPRPGPGRAPYPLWHTRGTAGLARRANRHRARHHAALCRTAGRASHPASTQHPRAGVRRPGERCSRRARYGARPGWHPDGNARNTSACNPSGLPAHRKMP